MMTFVVAFVCCTALAQRADSDDAVKPFNVPKSVMRSFVAKYPGIKPGYWLQEDQDYEAQFERDGKLMTAEFDRKGKWLNSETILEEMDLPDSAMAYVQSKYAGYFLNIVIFEESPVGKFYNVGITNDEIYEELIFDPEGNFVGKGEYVD